MSITQNKGDLGTVKAICRLTELGFSISIPISESKKYDLIAEKNGTCLTIQVKYCSLQKGRLKVGLRSIWSNSKGYQVQSRAQSDYDVLCIYCPNTDTVYFLRAEHFVAKTEISLRQTLPESAQKSKVRLLKDYESL